jgi:Spy/CpxP family protein refolding chaperone
MTPSIQRRLLAGAILLTMSTWVWAAPPGRRHSWWRSEEVVKELGLTAEQSARIDKIYQAARPELRQEFAELDRMEAKLSRLIESDTMDETILARQIDRVETARAHASKTRSLMLWRMRQVLTVDQRARLKAIQERWERERRQGRTHRDSQSFGGSKLESFTPSQPAS